MKKKILISLIVLVGIFFLYATQEQGALKNLVRDYIHNGEFLTLEARFTPEQIMHLHKQELLKDEKHTFSEPSLKFYPYLLMEAKYLTLDKKSKESVILWGMVDGEMVLNTETWEKTHGFEDAIRANANLNDFKILNALAKYNGFSSRDQLHKELQLDYEVFSPWLESAKQKHLIVQKGDNIQLHSQNPKVQVSPQTKINQWLVTKPYNHAQRVNAKYSQAQIEKLAFAAFGPDFTIRNVHTVFLPVYGIDIINPDGSILTTFWNALNGKRIHQNI